MNITIPDEFITELSPAIAEAVAATYDPLMKAHEAADYLKMSTGAFNRIKHTITHADPHDTGRGCLWRRSELDAFLKRKEIRVC